jgi:hypothetical protein
MISATVLVTCFAFGTVQQVPSESASQLISRMIARYNSARSIQGTIRSKQSAKGVIVDTLTEIAIDGQQKLSLRQIRTGGKGGAYYVVANGQFFAYDRPENVAGKARFVEPQMSKGQPMTVRDIYIVVGYVIAEKSVPLDLLFSRMDDLRAARNQWGKSFKYGETVTVGQRKGRVVIGTYLPYPEAASSGRLEMVISEEGDLLRYSESNSFVFQVPEVRDDNNRVVTPAVNETILITTVWDVDVKVNEAVDPKLFETVR